MTTSTCPSRDALYQYSIGMLNGEQRDALDEHLDGCPDCQATIVTLDDADDTVAGRLRVPLSSESFLAEPQLNDAMAAAMARPLSMLPLSMPDANAARGAEGGSAFDMPQILGEYQLLEELGRGGMGTVYKALQTKLDRVVALKVLSRGRVGDRQAINRFEREMKAVGRLAHPNIVQAYDAREINDMPVLIMEFVDGLDLAELVRRCTHHAPHDEINRTDHAPHDGNHHTECDEYGAVPVAEACELVRRAALALHCAHEHGLVHRDIKPSNIMLARSGEVKLLDLGLARFYAEGGGSVPPASAGEEMTDTGQAMGTADYMAPEQASDSRNVDIRADIYSLGCTLYKLLSGRAPFSGAAYRSTLDKLNAHVHQPVPPIRDFVPEVPEELAAILARVLAKDPGQRFATPAEVAAALEPFCRGANLTDLIVRAMANDNSSRSLRERPSAGPFSLGERARVRASARRPILRRILIGLGFLGALAAAFAAGIVITIIRDGKKTTVDVPDGSNARVTADGQLEVELPSQSKSAEEAPKPAESPLQFGPVIERVVNALGQGKGGDALDLVGGKLVDVPKEFGQWSNGNKDAWSTKNNVDLVVDVIKGEFFAQDKKKLQALMPEGLKLAVIQAKAWEIATGAELRSALTSLPLAVRGQNTLTYYVPFSGNDRFPTFAFETRKGDLGILQIVRDVEEPRGFGIRYKLVQPSDTAMVVLKRVADTTGKRPGQESALGKLAGQPPTVNPETDLKALQGPWKAVRVEKGKAADPVWTIWRTRINVAAIRGFSFTQENGLLNFWIFLPETGSLGIRCGVDDTTTPKKITLDIPKGFRREPVPSLEDYPTEPEFAALGIYELDGQRLKICLTRQSAGKPETRPRTFAVDSDSRDVLFVLERPAKADGGKTASPAETSLKSAEANPISSAPPAVAVIHPIGRNISDHLDFAGRTRAAKTAEIRARVTGELIKVHIKQGMPVKQGDLLLEIDPKLYQAEVDQAINVVKQAKIRLDARTEESKRLQELVRTHAVSQEEADQAKNQRAEAEAALQAAAAALEVARLRLEYTRIIAPFAGVISGAVLDEGNLATADKTTLATITTIDPLHVDFQMDEASLVAIRRKGSDKSDPVLSLPVLCGLAGDKGYPYRATMDFVDSHADPATGAISCCATLANKDGALMPGTVVRVRLVTSEPHQALLLPHKALFRDSRNRGQTSVFLVTPQNVIQIRAIQAGGPNEDEDGMLMFAVNKGLTADEWVIEDAESGRGRWKDGMTVKPKKPSAAAPPSSSNVKPPAAGPAAGIKPNSVQPGAAQPSKPR